ncbi:MAG: hypothetical protein JRD93_06715 [Deltaproteobacteria bacterium]|nr:hypothetical protein [Deltaproteobacteria bacterium]MBW2661669.1 hypothetical protein [Deltaproteobacteria bacterium]
MKKKIPKFKSEEQNSLLKSKIKLEDTQRPKIITIMCALYIFNISGVILVPFSDKAWSIGFWWPPYLGFSAVILLICIYGFWGMKKWSIILYMTFIAVNQIVMHSIGRTATLIIPGIVLLVLLSQYRKMT